MPGPGDLRERVRFQRPTPDEFGEAVGPWVDAFPNPWSADILFLRGTETVMAQRLNGVRPGVITVRDCSEMRQVTNAWRVIDVRTATRFDVISPPTFNKESRRYLDILVEAGRAEGGEATEGDPPTGGPAG